MVSINSIGSANCSNIKFGNNNVSKTAAPEGGRLDKKQDSITIAGKTIKKKDAFIGAAAIVTMISGTVAAVFASKRGKIINTANNCDTKLLNNLKEGLKSIFTKEGQDSYRIALEKTARSGDISTPVAVPGEKPSGGKKPSGTKPNGGKPKGGTKPDGHKPSGTKPNGGKPKSEKQGSEQLKGEKTSGGKKPSKAKPKVEKPVVETPARGASLPESEPKIESMVEPKVEIKPEPSAEIKAEALKRTRDELKAQETAKKAQEYYTNLAIPPRAKKNIYDSAWAFNREFKREEYISEGVYRRIRDCKSKGKSGKIEQIIRDYIGDALKRVDKTVQFADGTTVKIIYEGLSIDITSDGKILQKVLVPNSTSISHVDVTEKYAKIEASRRAKIATEAVSKQTQKTTAKNVQYTYA